MHHRRYVESCCSLRCIDNEMRLYFKKKASHKKNWRIETSKKSYTAQPPVRLTAKVGDLGRFLPN